MALIEEEHIITKISDGDQVVGDEHIGQSQFLLQFPQQIHDLDLGMGVQGRDGLVKEDDLRTAGYRPSDAHPLELAAGELMGVKPRDLFGKAVAGEQLPTPGAAAAGVPGRWE